jgi:hypothetical protein
VSHWPEHCELQTSTWSCYYKDEIRIRETSPSSCRFSLSFPAGQVGIHKISRPNSIHTYREWIQDGSGRADLDISQKVSARLLKFVEARSVPRSIV